MKTLGDAILVRNRIIEALDIADNHPDETERKAMLTVVVAGGGFAGVETAGAVNDLLREAIKFYPNLREDMLRVVLVHAGEVILPELSASLGLLRPETARPARRGHSIEDRRHRLRRQGIDLQRWHQHRHPPGDLDRGHHTVAVVVESALRHTAGPRAGKRVLAGPGLARCMDARRLCARAGSIEPGQVLSTHRAARHPPGRRARGQYRGGNAEASPFGPSGSRPSACLPPSAGTREWRRFSE